MWFMKYKCYGKTFWVGVVWQKFRLGVVSGLSSFHIFVYPGRSLVAHAPTRTPPAVYSLPRTLSPGHCPYRYPSAPHSRNTSPRGHHTAGPSDGLRILGTQSRLVKNKQKSQNQTGFTQFIFSSENFQISFFEHSPCKSFVEHHSYRRNSICVYRFYTHILMKIFPERYHYLLYDHMSDTYYR